MPEGDEMTLTTDPSDPRLTHGADPVEGPPKAQAGTYLVLSEDERAKDFVRPVRLSYWHTTCGAVTTMNQAIAETYARSPQFYGATYCATCGKHRPVGADGEFHWVDPDYPFVRSALHPKVGT
jgi:hypothetical protein